MSRPGRRSAVWSSLSIILPSAWPPESPDRSGDFLGRLHGRVGPHAIASRYPTIQLSAAHGITMKVWIRHHGVRPLGAQRGQVNGAGGDPQAVVAPR